MNGIIIAYIFVGIFVTVFYIIIARGRAIN